MTCNENKLKDDWLSYHEVPSTSNNFGKNEREFFELYIFSTVWF